LDIHEVQDDERGCWARLNHDLDGRGVPDLEAARMDIVLGELYYRFTELFKPALIPAAARVAAPVPEPDADAAQSAAQSAAQNAGGESPVCGPELKAAVRAFAETARKFIGGAGVYEPWKPSGEDETAAGTEKAGTVLSGKSGRAPKESGVEEAWEAFTVYLERMTSIPAEGEETGLPAGSALTAAYAYAVLALLKPLAGGGASGAEALSLAVHWQLDRKLREILVPLGIAPEAVEIMKAVLARSPAGKAPEAGPGPARPRPGAEGPRPGPARPRPGAESPRPGAPRPDPKALARALILDNYDKDDFRRILGVNVFDDITWFNKEAFDLALSYGPLFAAMEGGGFALTGETVKELRRAEAQSGYDLVKFIEALTPSAAVP
jgi:hypothetical protein